MTAKRLSRLCAACDRCLVDFDWSTHPAPRTNTGTWRACGHMGVSGRDGRCRWARIRSPFSTVERRAEAAVRHCARGIAFEVWGLDLALCIDALSHDRSTTDLFDGQSPPDGYALREPSTRPLDRRRSATAGPLALARPRQRTTAHACEARSQPHAVLAARPAHDRARWRSTCLSQLRLLDRSRLLSCRPHRRRRSSTPDRRRPVRASLSRDDHRAPRMGVQAQSRRRTVASRAPNASAFRDRRCRARGAFA